MTASGIPEHAVVVERMNREVLNLFIEELELQKTISPACITFVWALPISGVQIARTSGFLCTACT